MNDLVSSGVSPNIMRDADMEEGKVALTKQNHGGAGWRHLTHFLLGLLLGETAAILHFMPWNEPIHWVNIGVTALLFIYFFVYSLLGHSLVSVSMAIIIVMLCDIAAFNLIIFLQNEHLDPDYVISPAFLLATYLGIFVVFRLMIRYVRLFACSARRSPGPADFDTPTEREKNTAN